jgi:hypothetical protein
MYEQIIAKRKNGKIGLSWEEEVFLILLTFLRDPGLTEYFLKLFRDYMFEDSLKFHCSLRRSGRGIAELYKKKQSSLSWSPAVPLSCDVPISVTKWRKNKTLKEDIGLFYEKFIGERVGDLPVDVNSVQKKINIVNHVRQLVRTKFITSDSLTLSLKRHINGSNGSLDIDDYGGLIADLNQNSGYLIL